MLEKHTSNMGVSIWIAVYDNLDFWTSIALHFIFVFEQKESWN